MRLLPSLILLSCVLLAGCATGQRSDSLTVTLNAYANAIRWDDIQSAEVFVDPKLPQKLSPATLARYKQLRVSEYDDGKGPTPNGTDEVKQTVTISFIDNATQTERSLVDHQIWHYDAASKHWYLESGLPDLSQLP